MKSIKEKAEESSFGYDEVQAPAIGRGFVLGANYVLDEIEEFMNNLKLSNDPAGKFCKLVLMAEIHGFIEQLKGNQ